MLRRFDDKAESYLLYIFVLIVFSIGLFWLSGVFDSDVVKIYESGTLDSVSSQPIDVSVSIVVDGVEYDKAFNRQWKYKEYHKWLVKWTGYTVTFYHYDSGTDYFYDLYVHNIKNATVKKVMYDEDGFWWWEKPPMKVIFSDGSNFVFTGSSDSKFDMYSKFIAFDGEPVTIDYSFNVDDNIRIHNINRIKEEAK